MGTIADYPTYKSIVAAGEPVGFAYTTLTVVAGRPYSSWLVAAPANGVGVAPTTAVVPDNTTAGSLGQHDGGSGQLRCIHGGIQGDFDGVSILVDRLSHQGGLSGTTTGAQTTNLATAALTRYTSGVGVMIGIQIYTAVGTTATTITASYTNTGGTSGQTTPLVVFGGTGFREASRVILLPLQSGDSGVKSVESVTLAASTTTAGNFGVFLFKPLICMPITQWAQTQYDPFLAGQGQAPEIIDGACLHWIWWSSVVATGSVTGLLRFRED